MLSGCLSREGKDFIESSATQNDVKRLVEDTLSEEGVPVETTSDDAIYKPLGKGSQDEELIRVRYKTLHDPIFYSYALVNVDIDHKPRKLLDVQETGINHPFEYDLYDQLMEHTYQQAYKTPLANLKKAGETIPGIEYKEDTFSSSATFEPTVSMELDKGKLTNEKREALFTDYKTDKFASPSEQEAKMLLDAHLFLMVDTEDRLSPSDEREILPGVFLHYTYDGTFNEQLLDELLDALLAVKGLPDAFYTVFVKDTYKDEDLAPHEEPFADFSGDFRIDGDIKEKRLSYKFENEKEGE